MSELTVFPEAPASESVEWPGTMIGISNIMTRTKSRTKEYDKTVDHQPGKFEALMESARRKLAGRELFIHDVIIHGVRVRAHTNSHHLIDFWKENWFSPQEWEGTTGIRPPDEPDVNVYAFGKVEDQPEAAYYSRKHNTVIFFNTSYYGQLKSWVLGAAGRILAEKMGIHSIHGAAIERNGRGVLYIAPTGTGKSTSSYGMMDFDNTRFHSDDWVYVRYCVPRKGREMVSPQVVKTPDGEIEGYRCYRWLEDNRDQKGVPVTVLSLANERFDVTAQELDLDQPAAYAFISEKVFYLRANLVESFPQYTQALLNSRLENVPDVTPQLLEKERATLDNLMKVALEGPSGPKLKRLPEAMLRETILRLYSFDNARAMLRIGDVFGKDRIFANPMEPLRLNAVMLLRRTREDSTVLRSMPLEEFQERLMIGLTPQGKKEIAYNAYRAVDDETEKTYMRSLEEAARAQGGVNLYTLHEERRSAGQNVPETFVAEFELFRQLHRCAQAYDLNTILKKKYGSVRDAVLATMRIIAKTLETLPKEIRLGVDDVEEYIR